MTNVEHEDRGRWWVDDFQVLGLADRYEWLMMCIVIENKGETCQIDDNKLNCRDWV